MKTLIGILLGIQFLIETATLSLEPTYKNLIQVLISICLFVVVFRILEPKKAETLPNKPLYFNSLPLDFKINPDKNKFRNEKE